VLHHCPSVHMPSPLPRQIDSGVRLLPLSWQPSLNLNQVGLCIALFEACSVFTCVTACALANLPYGDRFTDGFGVPVTGGRRFGCYRLKR
jgi:hypothetical protein